MHVPIIWPQCLMLKEFLDKIDDDDNVVIGYSISRIEFYFPLFNNAYYCTLYIYQAFTLYSFISNPLIYPLNIE